MKSLLSVSSNVLSPKTFWIFLIALNACGNHRTPENRLYQDPPVNAKGDRKTEPQEAKTDSNKDSIVPNWFTKSPTGEGVEGTQVDRAYTDLNLKSSVAPIIVAVIDGGVDITHEDLQGHLWTNTKEIPNNGIDDDGNGYIDDVNGWNFLGAVATDGTNVNVGPATLEVTRQSARLKKLKLEREASGGTLTTAEAALLTKTSTEVEQHRKEDQDAIVANQAIIDRFQTDYDVLKPFLKVEFDDLKIEDIKTLLLTDAALELRRKALVEYAEGLSFTTIARVQARIDYRKDELDFAYNEAYDPRAMYMHNDADDLTNPLYGNPDVAGDDPSHGTHVSGIIGAVRGNSLGIDGIAHDVRIMPIRAVPNGDEYDKDIANAIHYAVDNGARVINMSFGKGYSPHKTAVDAAFAYAAAHNVLLVHAAGNDATNTDLSPSFPNPYVDDPTTNPVGAHVPGWIDVGASSSKNDMDLPADFSNFGVKTVELFAPGVDIVSSVPCDKEGKNCYDSYSGTSMATPVVVGVAALVLSQKPDISAVNLRQLLLESARLHTKDIVKVPFEIAPQLPTFTYFGALSQTGGIVDAYAALQALIK